MGAIYHWYPKITGRMLDESLGKIHFWVTFLGSYLIFFPMHYVGLVGVPRRYPELGDAAFIPDSVATLNSFISLAAFVPLASPRSCSSTIYFGASAMANPQEHNPWRATTLEWQTPQTPPGHGNFGPELPLVYRWPYDYSVPGASEDFISPKRSWAH